MKKYWLKNLKIIAFGLVLSLGISYVAAQGGTNPQPETPLYATSSSSSLQHKEGALTVGSATPTTTAGVFLDVKESSAAGSTGVLGTESLLVSQSGKAEKSLIILNGSGANFAPCGTPSTTAIPSCTDFNAANHARVQVDGKIRSSNLVVNTQKAVCADTNGILVLCNLPGQSDLVVNLTGTGYGNVSAAPAGTPAITSTNCKKTASASVSCSASTYPESQSVVLTAAAGGSGSVFTGWTGCTPVVGTPEGCTVTMNAPTKTVTANFEIIKLTVTKTGALSNSGTVTSTSITPSGQTAINCGSTWCSSSYSFNTTVTLEANWGTGVRFDGWTVSGGTIVSGCLNISTATSPSTCAIKLNNSVNVGAKFEDNNQTLTLVKNGNGVVNYSVTGGSIVGSGFPGSVGSSCGSDCTGGTITLVNGSVVTMTASAGSGAVFTGWSESDDCSGVGTCIVTMNTDKNVTATFGVKVCTSKPYYFTGNRTNQGDYWTEYEWTAPDTLVELTKVELQAGGGAGGGGGYSKNNNNPGGAGAGGGGGDRWIINNISASPNQEFRVRAGRGGACDTFNCDSVGEVGGRGGFGDSNKDGWTGNGGDPSSFGVWSGNGPRYVTRGGGGGGGGGGNWGGNGSGGGGGAVESLGVYYGGSIGNYVYGYSTGGQNGISGGQGSESDSNSCHGVYGGSGGSAGNNNASAGGGVRDGCAGDTSGESAPYNSNYGTGGGGGSGGRNGDGGAGARGGDGYVKVDWCYQLSTPPLCSTVPGYEGYSGIYPNCTLPTKVLTIDFATGVDDEIMIDSSFAVLNNAFVNPISGAIFGCRLVNGTKLGSCSATYLSGTLVTLENVGVGGGGLIGVPGGGPINWGLGICDNAVFFPYCTMTLTSDKTITIPFQ